jgi:hypothetical protein
MERLTDVHELYAIFYRHRRRDFVEKKKGVRTPFMTQYPVVLKNEQHLITLSL